MSSQESLGLEKAADGDGPVASNTPADDVALAAAVGNSPKLPEAMEFSPGQVDLATVLRIVNDHAGDRDAQVEAIRQTYFAEAAARQPTAEGRLKQQRTRAYNVLVGMKGYGLLSFETQALTEVGQALLAEPDDADRLDAFAAHILTKTHGIEVLRAIESLRARGVVVNKLSLVDELRREGFATLPMGTTYHMTLLAWLREAGVVVGRYDIDGGKVSELAGTTMAVIDDWSNLTRRRRAFLQTLRRLADVAGTEPLPVRDVLAAAIAEHGPIFREDQLRADVVRPLEELGWVTTSGIGPGRGGKSGNVHATEKLRGADFEQLTGYVHGEIPQDIRAKLNTPLEEVYRDLASLDTGVKGIALEVLAVRLAVDAGLVPLRFRLRSAKTGGAEVDLVAEGAHLHFSRWLFQCKNQRAEVPLSDLAKEVGMATLLDAHVVVMATTGKFRGSVRVYADELAATGHLQVVLIDGAILAAYATRGAAAVQATLHEHAQATMRLKRQQVLVSIEGADDA
jgi:hypothetical protein